VKDADTDEKRWIKAFVFEAMQKEKENQEGNNEAIIS
jgi:hypothetical protein